MATPDGISSDDWNVIGELAAEMAQLLVDQENCRKRMLDELDRLEAKYGIRASILATRADLIDDFTLKEPLLHRAYVLAEARGDRLNQLYVAHSLAKLYVQDHPDRGRGKHWLDRFEHHLAGSDDQAMIDDCRHFRELLAADDSAG